LEKKMLPEPNSPVKPDEFIGRRPEIEGFRLALQQGLLTGRTSSFAVLGDWGMGKSSLLLKFAELSAEPAFGMLPVFLSALKDTPDYLRLAGCLLDKFAEALANVPTLPARVRSEVRNWRLKRATWGGMARDREVLPFFLSSGSALLRHTLTEAWRRFVQPAHFRGAIFFLDDLDNITSLSKADLALILRDQFQSFGIEGLNYSVCFSARADYFSWVRSLAEPAVRFYERLYLAPFTLEETTEYAQAAFGSQPSKTRELAKWVYKKTLGHPYFLAFISQQFSAHARGSPLESPAHLWPEIFRQLEREKFSSDVAELSKKEIELLLAVGQPHGLESRPAQFERRSHSEYFSRLVERGLLTPSERSRYKLYHPLFKLFLQGLEP
jgi:hypothetical protein